MSAPAEPAISVLVCTRNRPHGIRLCIDSILASPLAEMELLVIDQSTDEATFERLAPIADPRLRLFRTPTKGLSRARNIGILASRAPLILFTDDDCIAEPSWVGEVLAEFRARPDVDAVYGRVKPYGPAPGPATICPTVIDDDQPRLVERLRASTHEALGHGNNMAFRRACFLRHGLYQEWLGAGTPMKGGEDTDFTFRLLFRGARVCYTPRPLVYHDNWMPIEKSNAQLFGYKVSAAVVFTRFVLRGSGAALGVLLHFWRSHLKDFWGSVKWKNWPGARHHLKMTWAHTLGVLLGLLFALRRPPRLAAGAGGHPFEERQAPR